MHLRFIWRILWTLGPVVGLTFAFACPAQSLPPGPGQAEVQRTCSACHGIATVTAQRLSRAGWANTVDNMISRGAQATPEEQQEIVRYLTANFGTGAEAPKNAPSGEGAASEQTQAPTPVPPAPVLDSSQIAQAKELIQTHGCLSCHRMDGKGSFAGPYLGDVGATYSARQIRTSLVSPSKELAPQNRSVRLVTRAGKAVVGKLLNQDGFSVQLIDASGHLLSFEKANLREFTILTANPMPSYGNAIPPQQLTLLIKFLQTQTKTNR